MYDHMFFIYHHVLLMWLRKKNGKPRPIKMVEVLRSCYSACLSMHQWGIGLPGAAEALSYWCGTIEELICDGTLSPRLAADLDLVNMFGNAEWPSIRFAIQSHLKEALPWKKCMPLLNGISKVFAHCELLKTTVNYSNFWRSSCVARVTSE